MPSLCKLKKICQKKEEEPSKCCREECEGYIHVVCCKLLLDRYNVKVEDRPKDSSMVFCTLTCHKKWAAAVKKDKRNADKAQAPVKKKRVPWEEDGSLTVLMDWLTTEGNYAAYCGCNGSRGKSKSQCQKDIALLIKQKQPESEREPKDVENKITSMERQFRLAVDWSNNTGQGVSDPGKFEAAILNRCPYFKDLEPIMGDRPNSKPLATNEDSSEEEDDESTAGVAPTAVEQSHESELVTPSASGEGRQCNLERQQQHNKQQAFNLFHGARQEKES